MFTRILTTALIVMISAVVPFSQSIAQQKRAVLSGTVVDSASRPLANAEVTIATLNLTARTNAEGEYRLPGISAGVFTVVVRRVGYVADTASFVFADNEVNVRRFTLRSITVLDSVSVNAAPTDPNMRIFDERKRVGIGTFLAREKLAKFDEYPLARVLPQLPGLRIVRGSGNRMWIASTRFNGGLGTEGKRVPTTSDKLNGATQQCYAKIYVDNALMYGGSSNEPLFDASTLQVKEIEAIEYYAGAAQAPAQYGGLGANCGVMVIWTRRVR